MRSRCERAADSLIVNRERRLPANGAESGRPDQPTRARASAQGRRPHHARPRCESFQGPNEVLLDQSKWEHACLTYRPRGAIPVAYGPSLRPYGTQSTKRIDILRKTEDLRPMWASSNPTTTRQQNWG
jgi:hypothetical protein